MWDITGTLFCRGCGHDHELEDHDCLSTLTEISRLHLPFNVMDIGIKQRRWDATQRSEPVCILVSLRNAVTLSIFDESGLSVALYDQSIYDFTVLLRFGSRNEARLHRGAFTPFYPVPVW